MPFKIGQRVKLVGQPTPYSSVEQGDVGTVMSKSYSTYAVEFPRDSWYTARESDLEIVKVPKVVRSAAVLEPTDERQQIAVKLIEKVTKGVGKFTGVKVESEGRLNRGDHCTDDCTFRSDRQPHDGCKFLQNNNVANDFILKHLAQYGLARKCEQGENPWSFLYAPKAPLVFSKVYNDSETEWTVTLSLETASDVLYTPKIVDAFNALAEANGNGIDVTGSGMHTAFIQGKNCMYPSPEGTPHTQSKMFENFAKSMKPLLPALYLLGANRIERGVGVTRSTSPRQPLISDHEKYSAVAYRYGALEFRVFDTCYDNAEQLLDNIVVMAQSVSKYWKDKYVKPSVVVDKPIYFGNNVCNNGRVNKLESLYVVKDHIVLLNKGLRCIKPPYLTVKEIKMARNFKLTVRKLQDLTATETPAYRDHVKEVAINQALVAASNFYELINSMRYSAPIDLKKALRNARARANRAGKKKHKVMPLEKFAYNNKFGTGFPLGEV